MHIVYDRVGKELAETSYAWKDYLELGDEARINTPGTAVGNWQWRLKPEQFDDETCRYMAYVTELYYRK